MVHTASYLTDFAIELSQHYKARERRTACEPEMARYCQIHESILPSLRASHCKLVNFYGEPSLWKSRLTAAGANQEAWAALQPQRRAAPLERLLFGPTIKLSFESIIAFARTKHTIVIDEFDRVKRQNEILTACNVSDSRFILLTSSEICSKSLHNAGFKDFLSVKLPGDSTSKIEIKHKVICD